MISLLLTLLVLPMVVAAGEKPEKPSRPSPSAVTLSGDVSGELHSPDRPTSRRIEADGTLVFASAEEFDLENLFSEYQGKFLDFTGAHDGHLTIELSPRRDTGRFSFVYSHDIDEDGYADHILLHSLAGFGGVGEVETISRDHVVITFEKDTFELWVAYKDVEGDYAYGEGWLGDLTITIKISKT